MTSKDEIKTRILTNNTAQGILKHLQDLNSNRARVQSRWIWELLQNARDASIDGDTELVASVELREDELVFHHNGRGFTTDEVGHLIFHGSTKTEDENTIGQYGSGFLTTHLLSPEIDVSGQLSDGGSFSFCLKREMNSAESLSESMDKAWDDFHASMETTSDSPDTQFRYHIQKSAADVVQEGIANLKRCAPFIVVFNKEFSSIQIQLYGEDTSFKVIERISLHGEHLQEITVAQIENGTWTESKYLLAEGDNTSVAIPLEQVGDSWRCVSTENIPKVFLGFPLIGTENFSFPGIINSFRFTPTEDRDGVYLWQGDDEINQENQEAIEEAYELHTQIVQVVAQSEWKNIYHLANIPQIREQRWLNSEKFRDTLSRFIEHIRQTPAVISTNGPATPQEAILPFVNEDQSVESLWDLLSEIIEFSPKLPRRDEAAGWRDVIQSWAGVAKSEASSFNEAITGSGLAAYVEQRTKDEDEDWGTLDNLQDLLRKNACAVEWLDHLYTFLADNDLSNEIRNRSFILDQSGYLDKLTNLYRDNDIDNELKSIAENLPELCILGQLRDTRLSSLADELGKGDYDNKDVVGDVIEELRELSGFENLNNEFSQASTRLLAWLVSRREWKYISEYPAFSIEPNGGDREPITLRKYPDSSNADIPLAPVKAWPGELQEFSGLFPWQHILSPDFFDAMPDLKAWQALDEHGFIRTSVIATNYKQVDFKDFLPDEALADGDHTTKESVRISDLVFISRDNIGVMERVRNSQGRARLFWQFLTEWLATHDSEGLSIKATACKCGESHNYFPAAWLRPLVRNNWVPLRDNRRDRASAQSLAKLLWGTGWQLSSLTENPDAIKFLEAIRVTRLDLTREFFSDDDGVSSALDDTLTEIIASTGGDLTHVREFVKDMETDEDLPQHLEDRRERRRIIHENQRLGERVEDLVKESLEEKDFTVRRTGIGSDFQIEHDFIEDGEEIGFELSRNDRNWLVEVKATRDQRVRITAKQAETAVEKGHGFLLCVVPVGIDIDNLGIENIRANVRFVQNIGPRVEPLCEHLDALDDMRDDAITQGDEDLQLEIQAGTARIRIDNTVWQDGIRLEDLANQLK